MGASAPPEAKASKRGKGTRVGYTYLHTAIDGFSRLAYTEALDDEKASTTIGFFCRARPSPRPLPPWPHATRGPVPTPHGTTARSSATTASWQRSASTRVPTPHSSSAATPSQCRTTTTTTIAPTPPATTSLLPPASQHTSPTS